MFCIKELNEKKSILINMQIYAAKYCSFIAHKLQLHTYSVMV